MDEMRDDIEKTLTMINKAQEKCCREVDFLTNLSAELVPGFLKTYNLLDKHGNHNLINSFSQIGIQDPFHGDEEYPE